MTCSRTGLLSPLFHLTKKKKKARDGCFIPPAAKAAIVQIGQILKYFESFSI